jgi:polar amino acid transport system substrate-binding protein
MYLTRRILLTALAAAAIGMGAQAQAEGVIKFGVAAEPYAPYTVKDASGKWTGWEVDVMDALCAKMNEKCEIVETAWDGIIPALTAKQIDVIWSSMSITDERKKTIDFSNMYYFTPSMIMGAKNGDMDITPAHLEGKNLGVQVSTTHQAYAEKYFGKSNVKTYQTQEEANQDLFAGRLDYVQADSTALDAFLKGESGAQCCEAKGMVPADKVVLGEGVGAGLRKEDTALKDKINAAIAQLAKDGTIQKITEKYPEINGKLVLPKG